MDFATDALRAGGDPGFGDCPMRVLITGGAGFIGSHLAARFYAKGHRVWALDNLKTGRRENIAGSAALYEGDIAWPTGMDACANKIKPNLVIHCAASYSNPDDWEEDAQTNLLGTLNVIRAAQRHNAKLIYFQTALPPISSYAISKIAAEQYIKISGVPYLIFRLSNIYGPRNLSGPIPAFYKRLAAGEECTVVETVRDMVYIDDLVECVMGSLEREGTYDVCSGVPVPILELYRAVAWDFDSALAPKVMPPQQDDVMPQTSVDKWVPGWAPKTILQDGIDSAVTWYSDNGVGETFTHLALKG